MSGELQLQNVNDNKEHYMMASVLPPELWWRVLSYLPSSSLCQMVLVCKYFRQLTMDPGLWSHVTIRREMIEREGLEPLLENIRY